MKEQPSSVFFISFSDLWEICKRSKKIILLGVISFSLLAALYTLTQPIEYLAQGSFREKGKTPSGVSSNNLMSLLAMGPVNSNSEAITTLKSRTLLERLIKQLDLQGTIKPRQIEWRRLSNFRKNLSIEYAAFRNKIGPIFDHPPATLEMKQISFKGEHPLAFHIAFIDDRTFQITKSKGELTGQIGKPFQYQGSEFTIIANDQEPLAGKNYTVILMPLDEVLKHVAAKITIETDKEDKNLLRIKFKREDRFQAAKIVNELMAIYQAYLWDEQQFLMNQQIDYLYVRHDEVSKRLRQMMEEHASNLSIDLVTTGFADTASAMAFLANTQQQYVRDLLAIELEIKRLQNMAQEGSIQNLRTANAQEYAAVNEIIGQIRNLKKQADTLEIALRDLSNKEKNNQDLDLNLKTQLASLHEQKQLYTDASTILASLVKGEVPQSTIELVQDPRYRVKNWYEMLIKCPEPSVERANCLNYFIAYVSNLQKLFQVHLSAMQEHLTHQQGASQEFQGIDLETSKNLYVHYNNDLNRVETLIKQMKFIIDRIDEPEFEISSLSNFLEDPVSNKMISTASDIVLSLRDQDNRSAKELDRLKHELGIQKGFLSVHLNQTLQLHQLQKDLIEEKIKALQQTTLALIRQEISVLDRHLYDHLHSSLESLTQEQHLLENHRQGVQEKMASLPQKWVAEKMIDQQVELNKKIVEEVAKLVESKNIARNLELIQSAPLDQASAPAKPEPPRLVLFIMLGAILGGVLSITGILGYALYNGLQITPFALTAAGYRYLGSFSKSYLPDSITTLLNRDLDILRKIAHSLISTSSKTALLTVNPAKDYAADVAKLMAKQGLKVVLLPVSMDQTAKHEENSLIDYLEGTIEFPTLHSTQGYDSVVEGGFSRFGQELLSSKRFQVLLEKLKERYDIVLMASRGAIDSPEVACLQPLADQVVITLTNETIDQFRNISPSDRCSYLFVDR